MSLTIIAAVDGMIRQMREYEIQESTVKQYYRGFCKPIIKFLTKAMVDYTLNLFWQNISNHPKSVLKPGSLKSVTLMPLRGAFGF